MAVLANEAVDKTLRSLSQLADAAAWVGTRTGCRSGSCPSDLGWYGSWRMSCTGADTYLSTLRPHDGAGSGGAPGPGSAEAADPHSWHGVSEHDLTRYTAESGQAGEEPECRTPPLASRRKFGGRRGVGQKQAQQDSSCGCPPSTEEVSRAVVTGEVGPAAAQAALPVAAIWWYKGGGGEPAV